MASGVRTEPKIGLDGLFLIEELMDQAAESSLGIFCIWDRAHLHSKAYRGENTFPYGLGCGSNFQLRPSAESQGSSQTVTQRQAGEYYGERRQNKGVFPYLLILGSNTHPALCLLALTSSLEKPHWGGRLKRVKRNEC